MKGIYKITNILNGKLYIGSSVNVKRRFITHRYHLNKQTHHCEHLLRSWNKYGEGNFTFEILEIVEDSKDLSNFEQKWINNTPKHLLLNSCKIAGNKTGFKHSEETKRKIGDSNKGKIVSDKIKNHLSIINRGKKVSDETKEKISKALSGKKRKLSDEQIKNCIERLKPYMVGQKKGFKHSDESIEKIRKSKLGRKQGEEEKNKRAKSLEKPIIQYGRYMEFIAEWESVKMASQELNIGKSFISLVLTGRKKTAKGYIFKYKNGV